MTHLEAAFFAARASQESPCQSKRGVAIFDQYGVVSAGHNHQPAPFVCDGSDRCKTTCGKSAIHAEQHAILRAERQRLAGAEMLHIKSEGGKMVASLAPSCLECSKLILESGIAFMCPVVDLIHKSGECLCGAYAKEGELEELAIWDITRPAYNRIIELQKEVVPIYGRGWGERPKKDNRTQEMFAAPLCWGCDKSEARGGAV